MIVALVLVSAFLHAAWNALLRLEPDKDKSLVPAIACAALFACIVAGVRWALGSTPFENLPALLWTLLAGAFEAVYFATLARALELGRLGTVYTVSRGGAVLVVWPLSMALYAERANTFSIAGSLTVLAGLALSSVGATAAASPERSAHRRGVAWAAVCAVSIAGYHLAYKAGLRAGGNPSAIFAVSLSASALISIARVGSSGRTRMREVLSTRWHRIVLMGLLCGGSFLILMEALARGGSGYVLTLRNTSVLFATLLAWTIGEKPRHVELVGSLFVAAGAVLMSIQAS
ncbi:MAG TPA: DMT family transporter [Kofleriaceae bacterium]